MLGAARLPVDGHHLENILKKQPSHTQETVWSDHIKISFFQCISRQFSSLPPKSTQFLRGLRHNVTNMFGPSEIVRKSKAKVFMFIFLFY